MRGIALFSNGKRASPRKCPARKFLCRWGKKRSDAQNPVHPFSVDREFDEVDIGLDSGKEGPDPGMSGACPRPEMHRCKKRG